jgi:hypothetical protein
MIKEMGINGTTADGEHAIPMTATKDVAFVAAKYLASQAYTGKSVQPILGTKN